MRKYGSLFQQLSIRRYAVSLNYNETKEILSKSHPRSMWIATKWVSINPSLVYLVVEPPLKHRHFADMSLAISLLKAA
jgi:hypothetical protein